MKKKELSKKLNVTQRYIDMLKQKNISLSVKKAKLAEELTGISRLKWLYPKEFGSPFEHIED